MAVGVRFTGANGQVQIDGTYVNYVVLYSGDITTAAHSVPTSMSFPLFRVTFPAAITSQDPPLIFIRQPGTARSSVNSCSMIGSPGNWTGFFLFAGTYTDLSAGTINNSQGYKYLVASMTPGKSSATVGVRVRNQAGQVVFDTGYKQLIFKSSSGDFVYNGSSSYVSLFSMPYPAGSDIYVLVSTLTGAFRSGGTSSSVHLVLDQAAGKLKLLLGVEHAGTYPSYVYLACFAAPGN